MSKQKKRIAKLEHTVSLLTAAIRVLHGKINSLLPSPFSDGSIAQKSRTEADEDSREKARYNNFDNYNGEQVIVDLRTNEPISPAIINKRTIDKLK